MIICMELVDNFGKELGIMHLYWIFTVIKLVPHFEDMYQGQHETGQNLRRYVDDY